jgi:hypothetical protein
MSKTTAVDLDELVRRTSEAFARGRAVLFLGAGATMEGKGPSGRELTQLVQKDFPDVDYPSSEFLDVCQEIVDTPPYDLEQLRNRVREHLQGVSVSNAHYRIVRLPWVAIFSTNYDDVVERAFAHHDCHRRCEIQYLEDGRLLFPAANIVPYFKLMGCVRRRANENGDMVLTRAAYNALSPNRHRALQALYDALRGGLLLFLGYSFGDRLVFDAIDDIIRTVGQDNTPWSFSVGPNPPTDETALTPAC